MFDPGGSQSRLRFCPFWGTWHALLCGEVKRFEAAGGDLLYSFWLDRGPRNIFLSSEVQATRPLFFRSG